MSPLSLCLILLALLLGISAQATTSSDPCGNLTVLIDGSHISWAELAEPRIRELPLTASCYLRPDKQALLPWLYTAIVLVVHLPLVIIRVVRWETVQIWCLATTLLTVVVYAQAYASTHFKGSQVFVWTPLILLIDAGSMAQIFFLIVEDYHLWIRVKLLYRRLRHDESDLDTYMQNAVQRYNDQVQAHRRWTVEDKERLERCLATPLRTEFPIYVAVMALLLLLAIITLQILGVVFANHAIKTEPVPKVRWCSPLFQPFGVAIRTGNCNIIPIEQQQNGIGCITLNGEQQASWLKGTLWGTITGIVLEFIDICILAFVNTNCRPRMVKMRRPWCTMFCGVAVLSVMLIFGFLYASSHPPGITERIWMVVKVADTKPMVFDATLSTSGLRGAIIGWHDGLFESWSDTYIGHQ